jgi:sirohydrochlorin ferrochelatase/SAM-dependent methyltransferase
MSSRAPIRAAATGTVNLPMVAHPAGPTSDPTTVPTVLLMGHGTRDPEGAAEYRALAADIQTRLGDDRRVIPCFLELSPPSILDALTEAYNQGVRQMVAVPCFLFGAGHVKNDLPTALQAARDRHLDLTVQYGAPLGVQPEMLAAVDARIAEAEITLPPLPREQTAILLVERGSNDPDSNAQVHQLARLLWEGRGWGWVETCFIGITRPSLEEGLRRCAALGARRVLVMPYFLCTGVLVRRIARAIEVFRERVPELEIAIAPHLGRHPAIIDLVVRRIAEADSGHVCMSCDRCKYRVALPGFEEQIGQPQLSDREHGLRGADGSEGGVEEREAFFGGLAAQWKPRADASLAKLQSFIAQAGVGSGGRVLDVGCGNGVLLALLDDAVGPTGQVTALDISPQMLATARRRHPDRRIRFILGDAADVPEPPASYDAIFCSSVIPHFADVQATFRHLASLLRPFGALMICHDLGREQLASVHARYGGAVGEDRLPPTEALIDMIRAAGLEPVGAEDGADRFWLLACKPGDSAAVTPLHPRS